MPEKSRAIPKPRGEQLARENSQLQSLSGLIASLAHQTQLDALAQEALAQTIDAVHLAGGAFYWISAAEGELKLAAANGTHPKFTTLAGEIPAASFYFASAIAEQQVLFITDKRKIPRSLAKALQSEAWEQTLVVPLVIGSEPLGAIVVGTKSEEEINSTDLILLSTFGKQISLAAHSAHLERKLTQSEKLYRILVESAEQAIFIIDQQGKFHFMNRSAAQTMGGQPEEFIGQTMWDRFPKDVAERQMTDIRQTLEAGKLKVIETESSIRGEARWFSTSLQPLQNDSGEYAQVLAVASDITRRIQAEKMRQQFLEILSKRNIQLQLAVELAGSIITMRDPQSLLDDTVIAIKQKFGFYYVGVFVLDEDRGYAVLKAGTGEAGARMLAEGHQFQINNHSMIGSCIASCQPLITQEADRDNARYPNPHLPETRAEMALPLSFLGTCLGAMTIQSTLPNSFDDEDITLMGAVADQLAVALDNARLYALLNKQRQGEQAALLDLSRTLLGEVEQQTIIVKTIQTAAHLLDVEFAALTLVDPGGHTYSSSAGIGWPTEILAQASGIPIDTNNGNGYTILQQEIVIVVDESQETRFPTPPWVEQMGIISTLFVPIILEQRVLGTLVVNSRFQREWSEDHIRALSLIANTTAQALERARLFEGERRARQQADILFETSSTLNASLERDQVLTNILEQLSRVINFSSASVMLIAGEALNIVAQRGFRNARQLTIPIKQSDLEHVRTLLVEHHPIIIADTQIDPRWHRLEGGEYIRSWLGVPLVVGDQAIGVLNLDHTLVNGFTDEDARLAMAFASQAAVAIQNASLFNEVVENETRFRNLLDAAPDVMLIVDDQGLVIRTNAQIQPVLGYHPDEIIGKHIEMLICENQQNARVQHRIDFITNASARFMGADLELVARCKDGRALPVEISLSPLQTPDGLLVIAAIRDVTTRKQAEENRRSYERYLEMLHEITQSALQAPNLETMLQNLADKLSTLFDADDSYLTLWDETTQQVIPGASSNLSKEEYRSLIINPGEITLTASVLAAGHPLVIDDVKESPHISRQVAAHFPAVSLLALPLIAGEKKLGAALIAFNQPHHFSLDDVARGEQIASQIALAIQNVSALDQERQQRILAEALHAAAHAVNSTLDFNTIVETILDNVAKVLPHDAANLWLIEEQRLSMANWRGYPSNVAFFEEFQLPLDSSPIIAAMLASGKPFLVRDTAHNADWIQFPQTAWVRSYVGTPIHIHGQVIGFLNLDSKTPNFFTEANTIHLQAFADQAAAALQNAQLFLQEQTRRQELAVLYTLSRNLAEIADMKQILNQIARSTVYALEITYCRILLPEHGKFINRAIYPVRVLENDLNLGKEEPPSLLHYYQKVLDEGDSVIISRTENALAEGQFQALSLDIAEQVGLVPIRIGQQGIGLMSLGEARQPKRESFNTNKLSLAAAIADQAAIAIENIRLYELAHQHAAELELRVAERTFELQQSAEALQEMNRRLQLINTVSGHLSSSLDINDLANRVVCLVHESINASFSFVGVIDEENLDFLATKGGHPPVEPGTRWEIKDQSISSWVVAHGKPVRVPDVSKDERYMAHPALLQTQSELIVPIRIGDRILGVLGVDSHQIGAYTPDDENLLLSIADQLGLAIESARSFQEARTQRLEAEEIAEVLFEQTNQVVGINRVVTALQAATNLKVASQALLESLNTEFGIGKSVLWIIEEEDLSLVAAFGFSLPDTGQSISDLADCAALQQTWQSGTAIRRDQFDGQAYCDRYFEQWLMLPIKARGEVLGVLVIEQDVLDEDTLRIIINQTGLGLASARSYEQLQSQAKELSLANRQLQSATQAKTDFMNRMSHELRTPLNAILGFARMLVKETTGPLNERQQRYVEHILGSGEHQLVLVNDVLDLAKVEAGKMELYLERILLADAFANVNAMISPQAEAKGIHIQSELSDPAAMILADRTRLRQILLNLLSNAVKFAPEGSRVSMQSSVIHYQSFPTGHRAPASDYWTLITVCDSGIGIKEEDFSKIFTEFEQIDNPLVRSQEGTGLGLALTKYLVELHDGNIWFESEYGKGTTFYVALPINSK